MYRCLAFLILVTSCNVIDSAAVKYVRFWFYTAAYDPYITLAASEKECREICAEQLPCNGYSIDTSNNSCYLSSCNTFIVVPTCSTCRFTSKEIPLGVVLCSPTSAIPQSTTRSQSTTMSLSSTTTHLTTMPETTTMTQSTTIKISATLPQISSPVTQSTTLEDSTLLTQSTIASSSLITKTTNDTTYLAINNTSCVCVCKYVNQTLNESIERRRKEIVLNKSKVSRAIRKHTSVSDYRQSAEVIGTVAIVVLVLFGLIFFGIDVCSMTPSVFSNV